MKTIHCARWRQLDDAPIVAGNTTTTRLPTVHPLSIFRVFVLYEYRVSVFDHIFGGREPIVCGEYDFTAILKYKCHDSTTFISST